MKRLIAALAGAIMLFALTAGVFAAEYSPAEPGSIERIETAKGINDEKRAEMEKFMKEKTEKWDALTDAQKEEVYKLFEEQAEAKKALIEKYADLGIIDQDKAEKMLAKIDENIKTIREKGVMPGPGAFGGKGCGRHPGKDGLDKQTDSPTEE